MDVQWRIFGGPAVTCGGLDLTLTSMQARIIGVLLAHVTEAVPVDVLSDAIWNGDPPETADVALRMQIARIRKRLHEAGAGNSLVTASRAYRLDTDPDVVDARRFETLAARAREIDEPAERLVALDGALALADGVPFGPFASEPWAIGFAQHLTERRLQLADQRFDALITLGRCADAADELSEMVREHPYRERFVAQLMIALYRCGRQAEALSAYRSTRLVLVEELGIEPGHELRALEAAILRHDPQLTPRTRATTVRSLARPTGPLRGRAADLASVIDGLRRNRLVTITGIPGVGKSALAAVALEELGDPGVDVTVVTLSAADAGSPVESIARSVGVNNVGDDDLTMVALCEALRDLPRLLVIDGARDDDRVTEIVDVALATCPSLRILVTAWRPLHAHREIVVPLAPLEPGTRTSPGPATELLSDCIGLRLDLAARDEVAAVVGLAARAGGLPAAIGVLGALLDGESPLDHVDDVAATGILPERALARSVREADDVLPDVARLLLRRAHALPAGLDVDGAAALIEQPVERARRGVAALVRVGLARPVVERSKSRYRVPAAVLLATEQLVGADDRAAALDAATAHLTSLGLRVGDGFTRPEIEHLGLVELELDNVRALARRSVGTPRGLELVDAMATSCRELGRSVECSYWLRDHLAAAADADPLVRARATLNHVNLAGFFASYPGRLCEIREVASVARIGGDRRLWAVATMCEAIAVGYAGDVTAAKAIVDGAELRRSMDRLADPWLGTHRQRLDALVPMMTGDFQRASHALERCGDRFVRIGDPSGAVSSFFLAATAARWAGSRQRAATLLYRARDLAGTGGARATQALVSYELAQAARHEGRPESLERLQLAVRELAVVGNLRTGAAARRDLGRWLIEDGDDDSGRAHLAAAARMLAAMDDRLVAPTLVELAMRARSPGEWARLCGAASSALERGAGPPLSADDRSTVARAVARARNEAPVDFEDGQRADRAVVTQWIDEIDVAAELVVAP